MGEAYVARRAHSRPPALLSQGCVGDIGSAQSRGTRRRSDGRRVRTRRTAEDRADLPPPPEFAAQANASDPGIYERAAADSETWWASWAEKLEWIEPWEKVLEWPPPSKKRFAGGKLNVSAQLPRPPRRRGLGDRVAFHLGGGEATSWRTRDGGRSPTLAARPDAAVRERPQVPRHREGRRRRDLHADGPRGGGGDARLRADRGDPQRRLRRVLAGVGEGPDGGLRRQAPRHRRRGCAAASRCR